MSGKRRVPGRDTFARRQGRPCTCHDDPQLVSNVIKAEQNGRIKLLWISAGGEEIPPGVFGSFIAVPQTLTSFDQLGIKYTFVPGPEFGAIYGHVWDTWRKDLFVFAPQLFRHAEEDH